MKAALADEGLWRWICKGKTGVDSRREQDKQTADISLAFSFSIVTLMKLVSSIARDGGHATEQSR